MSRCIIALGTSHGAPVMILSNLALNRSRISILEFDAVPPQLDSVGPDGFQDRLVEEEFVFKRQL